MYETRIEMMNIGGILGIKKEATRDRYGQALVEIAKKDKNVVAMDCDLGRSTKALRITEVDPSRFIEMGIAEQDMISTAAGMAKMGKIVFTNSFAVFITGRAFDQIRQQVALTRLNVKICGSSSGITQGADGATHQSILDVGLMRLLPNMTIIVPADGNQTEKAVYAIHAYNGPVYLRLSRYETENFIPDNLDFQIGKAQVIKEGKDIVFASCGPVLNNVISASKIIQEKKGICAGIVNFHTLKPFDTKTIYQLAKKYQHIMSVEEHSIYGGLGSAVAECLAENSNKDGIVSSLSRIGIQDIFGESGTADELLKKHGLDPNNIADMAMDLLK